MRKKKQKLFGAQQNSCSSSIRSIHHNGAVVTAAKVSGRCSLCALFCLSFLHSTPDFRSVSHEYLFLHHSSQASQPATKLKTCACCLRPSCSVYDECKIYLFVFLSNNLNVFGLDLIEFSIRTHTQDAG